MLLNDFNVERYTVNQENIPYVRVYLSAEVVIKREGKHYAVPYNRMMECKLHDYCADLLETFIFSFKLEAQKITKNWKIQDENTEMIDWKGAKFLAEKPFEL